MSLKTYTYIWLILTFWLSYEYLIFNKVFQGTSAFMKLQPLVGYKSTNKIDPSPGASLSYFFGWLGFGLMCTTNLYILRKKLPSLQKVGKLSGWLDFHIFCGLMGPTFIVFHSNFKVNGLVAIAFWCMIITVASGMVGRYIYFQLLSAKGSMKKDLIRFENSFEVYRRASSKKISTRDMERIKHNAFLYVGGLAPGGSIRLTTLNVFIHTIIGDLKSLFLLPPLPFRANRLVRLNLQRYGKLRRRLVSITSFNKLLGYWHAFHKPFSMFMYVVAVIHIASALFFRVAH